MGEVFVETFRPVLSLERLISIGKTRPGHFGDRSDRSDLFAD
jgi:hypothetical protein